MREENIGLLDLIVRLDQVPGVERIRLGSLEPRIITEEFAGTLAGLKSFCPHSTCPCRADATRR